MELSSISMVPNSLPGDRVPCQGTNRTEANSGVENQIVIIRIRFQVGLMKGHNKSISEDVDCY